MFHHATVSSFTIPGADTNLSIVTVTRLPVHTVGCRVWLIICTIVNAHDEKDSCNQYALATPSPVPMSRGTGFIG